MNTVRIKVYQEHTERFQSFPYSIMYMLINICQYMNQCFSYDVRSQNVLVLENSELIFLSQVIKKKCDRAILILSGWIKHCSNLEISQSHTHEKKT